MPATLTTATTDRDAFPFTDADAPAQDFTEAQESRTDAPAEADAFVPDTEGKVDWVLSKIAAARAAAARIRENGERMAKEADAEADSLLFRFGPALQAFARKELTGRKKSIRLFHGVIGYRTRPAALTVTDERAALEWARTNLPAAVTERVDKAALSAALLESGEVVQGTQLVPAQEVFFTK